MVDATLPEASVTAVTTVKTVMESIKIARGLAKEGEPVSKALSSAGHVLELL